MDVLNSTPPETESVPASVPAQTPSTPESAAAPAPTPAPAPVPAVKMEIPKTDKKTVGGWNRFAGYNPNAAKAKQKDGRKGGAGRK